MPENYIAPVPMDIDRVTLQTLVFVPVWLSGAVVGWDYGHVVEIRDRNTGCYTVCLKSAETHNGKRQIYYGYSIACGICHGQANRSNCFQCFPGNIAGHVMCCEEFKRR